MHRNEMKIVSILLALATLLSLTACGGAKTAEAKPGDIARAYPDAHVIKLLDDRAKLDGEAVQIFDYTWHCDPGTAHGEVKDAPAEYFTGTKPETTAAAYIDHELYYFPQLPEENFKKVNYDGEYEWAYYYTDGEHDDFIFATLPNLGNSLPAQMMHSGEEAAQNQVLHIIQPGAYVLEGNWKGQIKIDLGDKDETFADENAKVTVILNGADISCTVAPGVLFESAYECNNTWEDRETHSNEIDTSDAGVTVVIADGTENTVTGTNVFRMLKTKYKDEDSTDSVKTQKKMRKTDAAFYSCVTMKIEGGAAGTGRLTVNGGFEGLDSELHLSLSGGNVTINSQDDGINVNEDNVSVAVFNGGSVTIHAAQGVEGDGVDSNGFIVLNGGTVSIDGIRVPDSALDSEDGITYNGGTVILDGETQSYEPGSTFREIGGMGDGPGGREEFGGTSGGFGGMLWQQFAKDFDMKQFKQKVAELDDDATLEDVLAIFGIDLSEGGFGGFGGGQQPPEMNAGQIPQKLQ